jgi:hypothetical protein
MTLANCTAHAICLYLPNGRIYVLPPAERAARILHDKRRVETADEFPVRLLQGDRIVNLPPPEEGTTYIVSTVVALAAAAKGRNDVVAPDVSRFSAVRNEETGQLEAVRGFHKFAPLEAVA